MVRKVFTEKLISFEPILNGYGFYRMRELSMPSKIFKENQGVEYQNRIIGRRIDIDYTIAPTGQILIGFTMYVLDKERTFFSLSNFIDRRGLQNKIAYKIESGNDFEIFIKKYFEDLESLFKNELNEQITGKSFENHMDLLNQSWNEHRDVVYEMEKSVVEEYKKKKDD